MIQSTTPASSTYSRSNSSQHDPSSPPHISAITSSEHPNNSMYPTNTSSSSAPSANPNRDALDQSLNGVLPSQYRTSTAFNPAFSTNPGAFAPPSHSPFSPIVSNTNGHSQLQPQQQQQQQPSQPHPPQRPYRPELSSPSYSSPFGATSPAYTKADVFGTSQSLEPISRFEYEAFGDVPGPPSNSAQHAHTQPHFTPKHNGAFTGSALLQSQQVQVPKQQQAQSQGFASNGVPYLNGGHAPHLQPSINGIGYGPPGHAIHHGPGPGSGAVQGVGMQQAPSQQQGVRGEQPQEEISTIFVVGFPEDMHEREFQNMFTFSVGFEAATLKIPNKDSSAYGPATSASGAANALRQAGFLPTSSTVYFNNTHTQQGGNAQYSGAQDPYNLVTVNSGGVVVDGPQGTSSSWQQASDQYGGGDATHTQAPAMPPRKQIIGFAKFRSRQEALDARDILQGRRVDIEKGAVLKAEMAKKNLHTKRGVGPLGLPLGLMGVGGSVVAPEVLAAVPGLNGFPSAGVVSAAQAADALSQRDRELSVLGAMGLGGLARRAVDVRDEDKERRELVQHQAQRPRDEEERRRKEKEERNNKLRLSNTTVYDAFHSVPPGTRGSNSTTSGPSAPGAFADPGSTFPGYTLQNNGAGNGGNVLQSNGSNNGTFGPHPSSSFQGNNSNAFTSQDAFPSTNTPWSLPSKPSTDSSAGGGVGSGASTQKAPGAPLPSSLPPRPPSSLQSSPPTNYEAPFLPQSSSGARALYTGSDSSTFSPPDFSAPLPPIGPRHRAHSPTFDAQQYGAPGGPSSLPQSSSSSVAGSQSSLEGEFSRRLTVSTHQGMTSPQLPSPGSGGSSNNARQGNASDQNPPINTLYVGNLPNAPVPTGYPPNYLEESLRALFSRCSGYRKLCFRQKSNGPMCFVEFEDVAYATKALNELYGNQLNGLVKGGIRLSFSKNPLGVRPTPSNANSSHGHVSGRRDGGREWNGHAQPPQQQQQPHPGVSYSMHDAFQGRGPPPQQRQQLDTSTGRQQARHDPNNMGSPTMMYNYTTSPPPAPPSRFFSPPPSATQTSFGGIITPASASTSFSRLPPQTSSGFVAQNSPSYLQHEGEERARFHDPPPHPFSPSSGLETTRAG